MSIKNGSWSSSTSDAYEYWQTDSASTASETEVCKTTSVEGNKMSLCFAFALHDKVYLAADSRSIMPDSFSQKNNFTHRRVKQKVLSDEYKKIFKLPIPNRMVVGFSTGRNTFSTDGLSLSDFIKQIDFSCGETLIQYATILASKASQCTSDVYFELFEYVEKVLYRASISVCDNRISISSERYQPQRDEAYKVVSGAEWAKQLLDFEYYIIPENDSSDELYNMNTFIKVYKKH